MQRGGTIGLLLVVFGILVVTMWGGYYMFKADPEPERAPTPLVEVVPGSERKTRSYVILDNNFASGGGFVYYNSGTDSEGEPIYAVVRGADPETFKKIGTVAPHIPGGASGNSTQVAPILGGSSGSASQTVSPSTPTQPSGPTQLGSAGGSGAAGTSYSVTYYSDENNVYMVIESGGQTSSPQIVVGADPETFQILNAEYSKDAEHVYVIIVTCDGGVCSASVSIVASADPDTFQAFPSSQNVLNSDCTGYVVADGQDANNVYNNGQIVDGVSVYLIGGGGNCDDTPVLISP